jgi:hypothetical protein
MAWSGSIAWDRSGSSAGKAGSKHAMQSQSNPGCARPPGFEQAPLPRGKLRRLPTRTTVTPRGDQVATGFFAGTRLAGRTARAAEQSPGRDGSRTDGAANCAAGVGSPTSAQSLRRPMARKQSAAMSKKSAAAGRPSPRFALGRQRRMPGMRAWRTYAFALKQQLPGHFLGWSRSWFLDRYLREYGAIRNYLTDGPNPRISTSALRQNDECARPSRYPGRRSEYSRPSDPTLDFLLPPSG